MIHRADLILSASPNDVAQRREMPIGPVRGWTSTRSRGCARSLSDFGSGSADVGILMRVGTAS
jgi:hypothetical protein